MTSGTRAREQADLAQALAGQGRHGEAAAVFRVALDRCCDLSGISRVAARSLAAIGDGAGAARLLGLAAAESPGPAACREVAVAWQESGHLAECIPWYRRAGHPEAAEAAISAWQAQTGKVRPAQAPDDPLLREALRRVPLLARTDWRDMSFASLTGGRHNRLYRIDSAAGCHVLRLERFPAARWYAYGYERTSLRVGHGLGLAPEMLYFDEADGTLVQPFVNGRLLTNDDFDDEQRLRRVGRLFARLHGGPSLQGRYDIFRLIRPLERKLSEQDRAEFPDVPRIGAWIHILDRLLRANGVAPAPCHNDPVPANLFDDGERLKLIDWQCAGMADPDYEVGYFLAEVSPDPPCQRALLEELFGRADHPRAGRVLLYQAISRYYWLLFGLQMRRDGRPEAAWGRRVRVNLRRLRRLGGDEIMSRAVEAVSGYRERTGGGSRPSARSMALIRC